MAPLIKGHTFQSGDTLEHNRTGGGNILATDTLSLKLLKTRICMPFKRSQKSREKGLFRAQTRQLLTSQFLWTRFRKWLGQFQWRRSISSANDLLLQISVTMGHAKAKQSAGREWVREVRPAV